MVMRYKDLLQNETPTVCGLATDNNNMQSVLMGKMETIWSYKHWNIILWNNHYNLNFNVEQQGMKMSIMHSL